MTRHVLGGTIALLALTFPLLGCGTDTSRPRRPISERPSGSAGAKMPASAGEATLRCGHGAHPLQRRPGPAVTVGPVAFEGLPEYAGAPPSSFAPLTGPHRGRLPAVELTVIVTGRRSVTLAVPRWEQRHVLLLTHRSSRLQVEGYRRSDGVGAITIHPCRRATVIWGGFIVVGRRCAALDVLVAGHRPRHAILSFGAGRCGPRPSPPEGLPPAPVVEQRAPTRVTSQPVTHTLPARARTLCARRRLPGVRIPVLCPTVLPTGSDLIGPVVIGGEPFFYTLLFNVTHVMAGPAEGRLTVGAGTPRAVREYVLSDAHNEVPGRPSLTATTHLEGRLARIYRFPPDPRGGGHGGDVAAFAQRGRLVVFASVHGYGHSDTAIVVLRSLLRQR